MPIETTPFDAAKHLDNPEAQAAFLTDALETGDAGYIAHAMGVIVRARGMSQVARDAGLSREALYKALSRDREPHAFHPSRRDGGAAYPPQGRACPGGVASRRAFSLPPSSRTHDPGDLAAHGGGGLDEEVGREWV